MWQLSSVGRAMDWKSMCPRFDPGSGHHFFAFFLKAKKHEAWKGFRFMARSAASCTDGALHTAKPCFIIQPFQMKQLHFVPQWSICCSQIWSTSVLRRLYNMELCWGWVARNYDFFCKTDNLKSPHSGGLKNAKIPQILRLGFSGDTAFMLKIHWFFAFQVEKNKSPTIFLWIKTYSPFL